MEMSQRLRIGFVGRGTVDDKRIASGTPYSMARALGRHCGDIVDLGPIPLPPVPLVYRAFWRAERLLTGKRYNWYYSRPCCKRRALMLRDSLEHKECDMLFGQFDATWTLALLDTVLPVIVYRDSAFAETPESRWYKGTKNRPRRNFTQGMRLQRRLLHSATAIVSATRWATEDIVRYYGVPRDRISIVPMGANLEDEYVPPRELALSKRKTDHCKLLFIGVDWDRKGGGIAFDTLVKLGQMGVNAELTVCGCTPPSGLSHEKMTVVGFLDKNRAEDRQVLSKLLAGTDFLFVPTRADTFGIVFCEANAYGVPAIATEVGGVAEVIRRGVNGYTLPLSAGPADYAELIRDIYLDDEKYRRLVRGSRDEFEKRLNWNAWARGVAECMQRVLPTDLAAKVGPA